MVKLKVTKVRRPTQKRRGDEQKSNKGKNEKIRRRYTAAPKSKKRVNSNSSSTSKSKGVGRKSADLSIQTSYRESKISQKAHRKWQPLNQHTKTFISSLIDDCLNKVVIGSSPIETKQALDELKDRMLEKMNMIKGPGNKNLNYSKLQREGGSLKKQCSLLAETVEELEELIDTENKLMHKTWKDLDKLKINIDEDKIRKTLFPKEKIGLGYPDYKSLELFHMPNRSSYMAS